jgi:RND family efflux transporter MFP subunit
MRNHVTDRNVILAAVTLGGLLVAGCGQNAPPPPASAGPPASVGEVRPKWESLSRFVEQPGTVEAYEETQLYARVQGYVRMAKDKEGRFLTDIGRKVRGPKYDDTGKEVEPGEVLAEVDVPDLVQQVKEKQALVGQMKADVEQAEKALAAAAAGITLAEASVTEAAAAHNFWEMRSKKFSAMVKEGTLEPIGRDEADKQFASAGGRLAAANAGVIKARADRDKAEADVKSVKSRVAVAEAQARYLEEMLGFATIRAPFDGIVTRRKVSTGNLVQASVGKGEWLFTVTRLDPVRVVVAVPETDAAFVKENAEVKLTVQALEGAVLTGKVARTSWDLEPGSRTLRAEIDLPNKDQVVRPGGYVFARINYKLPEAWLLPVSAVVKQGDTLVCFRIVEGKAVRTVVQVGRGNGQLLEVPKYQPGGPSSSWETWTGKEVVANRAAGLTDGQSIQPETGGK